MSEKLLVTIAEAATMASISRTVAYELVAAGEWPTVSIGRTRKLPVEALREWVQRRTELKTESATISTPSSASLLDSNRNSRRGES